MMVWAAFMSLYVLGGVATFLMLGATAMLKDATKQLAGADVAVWIAMSVLWPLTVLVVVIAFLINRK